MAAYLKLKGLDGESRDAGHEKWIKVVSLSYSVHRSTQEGARDEQRHRGTTTASDIMVIREQDLTSPKLMHQTATGKPFDDAEIHLTHEAHDKNEPYYVIKLKNPLITGYSFHGDGSGVPTEEFSINYTEREDTYQAFDDKGAKG